MTIDEHCKHLGGLLVNLQSLEFMIRAYLQKYSSTQPLGTPYGVSFYTYPVGSELPENELTNYDTLGILIDKVNQIFSQSRKSTIDRSIVDIRDALAHGRISASAIDDQMRLIKFTKPVNGKVKIVFNEAMTEQWFTLNKKRVLDAINLIHQNY